MSLAYISDTYNVPAKIGQRIAYESHNGTLVGVIEDADGPHLLVRFDQDEHLSVVHPKWHVTYQEETR